MPVSAFHSGEISLQKRQAVADKTAQIGARFVRHFMPEQHRLFFSQLALVYIGWMDKNGDLWVSILANPAGFLTSPDKQTLRIEGQISAADFLANLALGDHLGVLGLTFHNRRRNRASVFVKNIKPQCIELKIKQSFGNCAKYIQPRHHQFRTDFRLKPSCKKSFEQLDSRAKHLIKNADTFFIASANKRSFDHTRRADGVDVSHRGGAKGFVQLLDERTLQIPDYVGNNFFNTLGNIVNYAKVGLLFIDFTTGELLSLTGKASLLETNAPQSTGDLALPSWRFTLTYGFWLTNALPFNWREVSDA